MSSGLLSRVLVVELVMLALAYGLLLFTGARRIVARRRAAPRIAAARVALGALVGGRSLEPAERQLASKLSPRLRVRLLAELSGSLSGHGRTPLTAFARESGVVGDAERACRSRRAWRRMHGVRLLTIVGADSSQAAGLMGDNDPEVRAAAATWAADHPSAGIIDGLIAMLDDDAPLCRFAATSALLRVGGPAVEALGRRLATPEGRIENAMEVAIGIADPRLQAAALALAHDAAARRRALAAAILGATGGADSVTALTALLGDPERDVRVAAAAGLGKLRHWPAGPALAAALGDREWAVRCQAALALTALGPTGLVLLRDALDHPDRFARDMARQTLDLPDTVVAAGGR